MKEIFLKLLRGFEYNSVSEWACSMFPSAKYSSTSLLVSVSIVGAGVEKVFGIDDLAMAAFLLIMIVELVSGITASSIKKEKFSSSRLSRFGFKFFYYLVLISVPFLLASHYRNHDQTVTAVIYEWVQTFLIMQIFFENMISILENIAVIDGKDKTHIIQKIRAKLNSLI